jgi:hypothetical protein
LVGGLRQRRFRLGDDTVEDDPRRLDIVDRSTSSPAKTRAVSTSLAPACAATDRALLAKEEVGPQLITGVVRLDLAIDRHAQVPTVPAADAVPYRRSSELIPILAHKGSGQPQADADFAIGADEHTFDGNASNNIFGGQRPPGWRMSGHGVKAVPGSPSLSKTP